MICDELREAIDLCAIGALEPAEAERVRQHAATCPVCRIALRAADEAAAAFGATAPRHHAPDSLRSRVLAAARAGSSVAPLRPLPTRPARFARIRWLSIRYAAAAAAVGVLALAATLVWTTRLQGQVNELREETAQIQRRNDGLVLFAVPSSVKASFQPLSDLKGVTGAATWSPERGVCYVMFSGLPRPEAGTAYRLWYVVDNGRRVIDAGEIVPDEQGRAERVIDASQWRGRDYELVLRLERQPNDATATALLSANLRRPE